MKAKKSLVLLSGGLDSSVNLFWAAQKTQLKLALTFDYGQIAAAKEIAAAKKLTTALGIQHKVLQLPWVKEFGGSIIEKNRENLPLGKKVNIKSLASSQKTAKSVWVPNRNGLMINVAAGFAEALGLDLVIPGFNKEEAETFPDNSQEFLEALNHSFKFSTATKVKVHCFTVGLVKSEIFKKGQKLGVPFHELWPCYQDRDTWCGECESCLRYKRASGPA